MRYLLRVTIALVIGSLCLAQNTAKPEDATAAVVSAFGKHDIVMFGEVHGNKQEYDWLHSLVMSPEFSDRVDDIVVEFGNSVYPKVSRRIY